MVCRMWVGGMDFGGGEGGRGGLRRLVLFDDVLHELGLSRGILSFFRLARGENGRVGENELKH